MSEPQPTRDVQHNETGDPSVNDILNGILRYALRISQNSVGNPFDKSNAAGIVKIICDFQAKPVSSTSTKPTVTTEEKKPVLGGGVETKTDEEEIS